MSKLEEIRKARRAHRAAREELERVCEEEVKKNGGKPISDDNPACVKATKAVLEAEKKLSWWLR